MPVLLLLATCYTLSPPASLRAAADADGDGWASSMDCDDGDATINPATVWFIDYDGDGYGNESYTRVQCEVPAGFVLDDADCEDTDAAIHPGAAEVCDTLDQDCDSVVDEDAGPVWYTDADADGAGNPTAGAPACSAPAGTVAAGTDCNDADPTVGPSVPERCDAIDDDCDGVIDEDGDGDGYGACADCDDARATVHPGMTDTCFDGVDSDCDGDDSCDPARVESTDDASGVLLGESASDYAGSTVAGVGDVNGDGYEDLLVGATGAEVPASGAGAAYLVYGPVIGSIDLSRSVAKWLGAADGDSAGSCVVGGADVDGDGVLDLAIQSIHASIENDNDGAVYIVSGAETGTHSLADADTWFYGERANNQLGLGTAFPGDVDGDGVEDVILGSRGAGSDRDVGPGAAYLFRGPVSGTYRADDADTILIGDGSVVYELGGNVPRIGDVDGDGLADLFISAKDTNRAFLVLGPGTPSGLITAVADAELSGTGSFGLTLSGPGDVDGDGTPDLLVGSNSACQAWIFSGAVRGTVTAAAARTTFTSYETTTCYDFLGRIASAAGDVDGDGLGDVLLGRYEGDYWGGVEALLFTSIAGGTLGPADAAVQYGNGGNGGYGAMTGADIDGDGWNEPVLGAGGADLDGHDNGAVYLFDGA